MFFSFDTFITFTLFFIGQSVKVPNLRSPTHNHDQKLQPKPVELVAHNYDFDSSGIAWVANSSQLAASAQETLLATTSNQYVGCNSSSCFVDSKKVETKFQNQLILIIGCSLDVYAVGYFCAVAKGIPMETTLNASPFGYLTFCDMGQFTIAYAFTPGASPPPYAAEYNPQALLNNVPLGTSRDIIARTKNDIMMKFGRAPTAIVVDASLWDVSNWWAKVGKPPHPHPIPDAFITQWCNKDVPEFLAYIATVYPSAPIAFRTPPTIFDTPNIYGLSPVTVDKMVACIEMHKNPTGYLYGKFGLIDYHHFVDNVLAQSGPSASTWYRDGLHPGQQLSLMYLNSVMNWVGNAFDLNT